MRLFLLSYVEAVAAMVPEQVYCIRTLLVAARTITAGSVRFLRSSTLICDLEPKTLYLGSYDKISETKIRERIKKIIRD